MLSPWGSHAAREGAKPSLDTLAARFYLSPSAQSRILTGHRRIALDQLVPIARALGTTPDQLVESVDDDDVVIRPPRDQVRGMTPGCSPGNGDRTA